LVSVWPANITERFTYPKVPITRVETGVTSAAWYLANPKSAT
jgi:hypothetical protein